MHDVPAPTGDREAPLQCLIFDSQYDSYRGAIVYLRVMNGTVRPGMDIRMMATGAVYKVVEVGYLHPKGMVPAESLGAGEVGYLTASIKTVSDTRVGDTVTARRATPRPSPCPATSRRSRWSSPACIRPTARNTAICATRWKS